MLSMASASGFPSAPIGISVSPCELTAIARIGSSLHLAASAATIVLTLSSKQDGGDGTRYELCLSHDSARDEDAHVHFFCEKCHRTFCLEDIHIPPVTLPAGYSETTANYLIKGICPQCSEDGYGEQ